MACQGVVTGPCDHHTPPILLHCLYGFGDGVQPCLTKVHT